MPGVMGTRGIVEQEEQASNIAVLGAVGIAGDLPGLLVMGRAWPHSSSRNTESCSQDSREKAGPPGLCVGDRVS